MTNKAKYITDLDSEDALNLLLTSTQYHNFELPEYFDFSKVLEFIKIKIADKPYADCINSIGASELDDVNFDILLNKDGKYAVRPLILCNPYLYYFLCRELCNKNNWKNIQEHFEKCIVPHITACAMPIIPNKCEIFHKSTEILNWWNSIEQKSIKLSLKYRYMFVTDITNCYDSVNPQTIDWALSRKNTQNPIDTNHTIAQNIIRYICNFQHGKNIGIPQGSTLFDLIGEIILCYSDLLLHEALVKKGINDGYKILRYRDDYKVFCNDKSTLETISYTLQHILVSLNFRMNSAKTQISDSIITDSIKPDKLYYIFNTPILNKKNCDFDGLQKHLLYILMFARKFPNAGQLKSMLNAFDKRVEKMLKPKVTRVLSIPFDDKDGEEPTEKEISFPGRILENIHAMCAIVTQIAIENLSIVPHAVTVISRMIASIKNDEAQKEIIDQVYAKLINQPNSTYSKLWLQNMTYTYDIANNNTSRYDVRLCKLVMGKCENLWNNSWLKPELLEGFPQDSVVNIETLEKVTPIVMFREKRAYLEMLDEDEDEEDNTENAGFTDEDW